MGNLSYTSFSFIYLSEIQFIMQHYRIQIHNIYRSIPLLYSLILTYLKSIENFEQKYFLMKSNIVRV